MIEVLLKAQSVLQFTMYYVFACQLTVKIHERNRKVEGFGAPGHIDGTCSPLFSPLKKGYLYLIRQKEQLKREAFGLKVLLMVQKSGDHHLGRINPCK